MKVWDGFLGYLFDTELEGKSNRKVLATYSSMLVSIGVEVVIATLATMLLAFALCDMQGEVLKSAVIIGSVVLVVCLVSIVGRLRVLRKYRSHLLTALESEESVGV